MSFYTYAAANGPVVVFCFDVPPTFLDSVVASVRAIGNLGSSTQSQSLQNAITKEVVDMYDRSIWTLRDAVRDIETVSPRGHLCGPSLSLRSYGKQRRLHTEHQETDFSHLHDLARHATHVSEILEVAVSTVTALREQGLAHSGVSQPQGGTSTASTYEENLGVESLLLLQVLRNLLHRAHSVEKRLQNENNLVESKSHPSGSVD